MNSSAIRRAIDLDNIIYYFSNKESIDKEIEGLNRGARQLKENVQAVISESLAKSQRVNYLREFNGKF